MTVKFIIKLIKLYQATISPDHGFFKNKHPIGYCKFRPSCSDYAIQALEKYGIWKGSKKSLIRLIRCNPWQKGGLDLP